MTKPTRELPRGIRNNNPGNIDWSARNNWQGQVDTRTDPRFAEFTDPVWGIRAIARLLIAYYDAKKAPDGTPIDTIAEAIAKWAPGNENDTDAYVRQVDAQHPKTAWDTLNFHAYEDLEPLVKAIIRHENGDPRQWGRSAWYDQGTIDEALRRAGVVPKHARVVADPEVKSAAATAGGAVVATGSAVYVLEQVRETSALLKSTGQAKIESGDAEAGTWFVLGGTGLTILSLMALAFFTYKRLRRAKA